MIESDKNLLFTKLHRPPVPRDFVARPQLIDRLNDGLDGFITLVSAFAGSGKSTLISSWIEKISNPENNEGHFLPSIWVSLDENDNDLILLLRYLVAALRIEFPGIGSQTLELAQSSPFPPPDLIVQTFSNEIDSIPRDFIAVLDDYSALHGQAIHRYISDMLQHWPAHLHLVLLTRTKPPLQYSKLRSQGKINELYDADLNFSLDETTTYLKKTLPFNLPEENILKLEEETEGWIAGLQMAALSLRYSDDPEKFIDDLSGSEEKIYDYLIDEVLSKQPPVIRKFLLKTSILERFSLDLCQALFLKSDPDVNAANSLEWLKRNNLFIIPLDYRQEWYRYHHLFQDSLQNRLAKFLGRNDISDLQKKASGWYAQHGFIEDAIYYSVQSGDQAATAKLVEDGLFEVLNRQDRPTLERWLKYFDDEYIKITPGLLMLKFWVAFTKSQTNETSATLHQVEALIVSEYPEESLPDNIRILREMIPALFSQEYYFNNQPLRVIEQAGKALTILPNKWTFVRSHLMMYYGLAKQTMGQNEASVSFFRNEYENLKDKSGVEAECFLFGLGVVSFQNNELYEAMDYLQTVIRITSATNHAINFNWAIELLAHVHYLLNDLERSKELFSQIISHGYTAMISSYHEALSITALIDAIRFNWEHSWESLQTLSEFDMKEFGGEAPDVQSTRARCWLMAGELDKAFEWADRFQAPIPDSPMVFYEIPHLTKARVLIARNLPGDVGEAIDILAELQKIAEKTHNKRSLIALHAAQALALDAQGRGSSAQEILVKALTLSKGSGNIRAFADNGPRMLEMLSEMAEEGREVQAIQPILKSVLQNGNGERNKSSANSDGEYPVLRHPQLAESLTKREYDILVLLRKRMTNKEIADKLKLSPMTVKRHVTNLLSKVGVHKRWDAATRAVELGILPE
jgi:LuxR family transcriptional regulator, maltose regulon positive regulatory protein